MILLSPGILLLMQVILLDSFWALLQSLFYFVLYKSQGQIERSNFPRVVSQDSQTRENNRVIGGCLTNQQVVLGEIKWLRICQFWGNRKNGYVHTAQKVPHVLATKQ